MQMNFFLTAPHVPLVLLWTFCYFHAQGFFFRSLLYSGVVRSDGVPVLGCECTLLLLSEVLLHNVGMGVWPLAAQGVICTKRR